MNVFDEMMAETERVEAAAASLAERGRVVVAKYRPRLMLKDDAELNRLLDEEEAMQRANVFTPPAEPVLEPYMLIKVTTNSGSLWEFIIEDDVWTTFWSCAKPVDGLPLQGYSGCDPLLIATGTSMVVRGLDVSDGQNVYTSPVKSVVVEQRLR